MTSERSPHAYVFFTFSLSHFLTFSLSHFLTFSLSHFLTFSLSHFLTFSLIHAFSFLFLSAHRSVFGGDRRDDELKEEGGDDFDGECLPDAAGGISCAQRKDVPKNEEERKRGENCAEELAGDVRNDLDTSPETGSQPEVNAEVNVEVNVDVTSKLMAASTVFFSYELSTLLRSVEDSQTRHVSILQTRTALAQTNPFLYSFSLPKLCCMIPGWT